MIWNDRHRLEGAPNFRDLGGMETVDGRQIRPHRLLRCGHLHHLTPADRKKLVEEYELKTVIDLRTTQERQQKPDMILPGVTYYHCPIFDMPAEGVTRESTTPEDPVHNAIAMAQRMEGQAYERMCHLYGVFFDEEGIAHYRQFFQFLLQQEDGSVLWHCTMGKDRCGTASALLETALGVPWPDVVEDYLYTNVRLRPLTEATIQQAREIIQDEMLFEQMRILDSAQEAFLNTVRDKAITLSGSLDDFLRDRLGLTAENRARLQTLYLT